MNKEPRLGDIVAVLALKKPFSSRKMLIKKVIDLCDHGQQARSLVITDDCQYLSPQTVAYYLSELEYRYPQNQFQKEVN